MARKEPGFTLYKSVYESAGVLSDRARGAFFAALADYYFLGKEPDSLPRDARILFEGTRVRIERARSNAITKGVVETREAGYTEYYEQYEQYEYENGNTRVDDYGFGFLPAETTNSRADVGTDVGHDVGTDVGHDMIVAAPPQRGGTFSVSSASTLEELLGTMTARASQRPTSAPTTERQSSQGLERKTFGERVAAVSDFAVKNDLRMFTDNENTIPQLVQKWSKAGWRDDNGDSMDDEIRYEGELVPRWQACAMKRNERMAERAGYDYDQ